MSTDPSEFDRGHLAGMVAARLAGHDKHFEMINGSLAQIAEELASLAKAVQRLGDQAVARDATVITTAAALKDAESARRDNADQRWSPWQKGLALLAGVAVLVGLYVSLRGG